MDIRDSICIFLALLLMVIFFTGVTKSSVIESCATKGEIKYADTRIKCEVVRETSKEK